MDLQHGDLKKAGRRRRFGEEGGATALGSGGALTGGARAWRWGGSSAKRGGGAERREARASYRVFIFVSACFGPAERPWRPRPI